MTILESETRFVGRVYHVDYELPLRLSRLDSSRTAADRLRLAYLETGGSELDEANGDRTRTIAPSIVLLGPGDRLDIGSRRAQGVVVDFEPGFINALLSIPRLREPELLEGTVRQDAYLLRPFLESERIGKVLPLEMRQETFIRAGLANIVKEGTIQRDRNWPCRTRAYLIELLFQLRLAIEQVSTPAATEEHGLYGRALTIIRERLADKFSISDLARWCGTNRSSLNSAFRAHAGRSVRAHIIWMRMEVAAALLQDTMLPISEIMVRVGYENASHFSRQFRAVWGSSPGTYRCAESCFSAQSIVGREPLPMEAGTAG